MNLWTYLPIAVENWLALRHDVVPVLSSGIGCSELPFLGGQMPFILENCDHESFEIRVLKNDLEILAIVPIGRDPEFGKQYSAYVALIRLEPFDSNHNTELMFEIVETTLEKSHFIYSGLDRRVVLDVIFNVTARIVAERQPDAIITTPFQSRLPDKALVKYAHVSNAIRSSGYDGGEGNTYEGKRVWMFVKCVNVS